MAQPTKAELERENEDLRSTLEEVYERVGDVLGAEDDEDETVDEEDDD